jgi:hypothetical protein
MEFRKLDAGIVLRYKEVDWDRNILACYGSHNILKFECVAEGMRLLLLLLGYR